MMHTIKKSSDPLNCNWPALRSYLINEWEGISANELDKLGPNRDDIAILFGKKYGFTWKMAENYLRNIERTLPLSGN